MEPLPEGRFVRPDEWRFTFSEATRETVFRLLRALRIHAFFGPFYAA